MFLSDTDKSTSSNTKTEWTLNNQGLTNNLTETTYEIDSLSYSLKKDGYKGVASIFYNNNFLCNLTTLYSQASIYKKHGLKESTIISPSEEKLTDLEGNDIYLSNNTLRFKSKDYGIAGLRTVESNISFEVLFYGKYLTTVSKETAHKIESNKNIYLKEKLSNFNSKLKSKQTTSESEQIRKGFASKNYKITRLPSEVMLTTEANSNLKVLKRLDVITAECAYGMNIFKDLFASISDIFGGRNNSIQNTLRDARMTVLAELQREAFSLGANAVVGIDLDYSEISGGGKFGMLFIVASGTAVIVES